MKHIADHYDVVIVGAGPCGVTTAGLLGTYGINTLLIDVESDVVDIPRAVGICEEGSRIISSAGMMQDIEDDLLDINQVEFVDKNQQRVMFADLQKHRNGHRLLRMFSQPMLETGLRKSLGQHKTVEFFTETKLVAFIDDGVEIQLKLEQQGLPIRTNCQYLLACDGAKSEIRKALGIGFQGKTYAQDWMILDIEKNPRLDNKVVFNIDPARPSVTMPGPKGRRRWEFVVKQGESATELFSESNLAVLLKPWGEFADMNLVRKAVYTFHARTANNYQMGRVYLLGDAAHLTPPFAGQGMMAGLRDAYNIAWKLAAVLNKEVAESVLKSYEVERIPQSQQVISTAQRMGALILPQTRFRAKMRDGLIGFLTLIGLHSQQKGLVIDRVANHINGDFLRNRYQQRFKGLGFEFPQSLVSDVNGKQQLSDQFLGDRFYILSWQVGIQLSPEVSVDWQAMGGRMAVFGSNFNFGPEAQDIPAATTMKLVDSEGVYAGCFDDGERVLVIRPDKMIVVSCKVKQLEKRLQHYINAVGFKSKRHQHDEPQEEYGK